MPMQARAAGTHGAARPPCLWSLLRLTAIGAMAALSACTGDWDDGAVRALDPGPDPFDQALVDAYVDLAVGEQEEEDWRDVDRFLARARRVAGGEAVVPDRIEDRELPPDAIPALETARVELVTVLARGGRIFAPVDAARAQALFDCWIQEAEEDHQQSDIDNCRRGFMARLDDTRAQIEGDIFILLPGADGSVGAVEIVNEAGGVVLDTAGEATLVRDDAQTPGDTVSADDATVDALFSSAIAAEPDPPAAFILYFEVGSTTLTPESEALLPEIVAAVGRMTRPRASVIGHADRQGPAGLNAVLSRRRAAIIRDVLLDLGLEPGAIEIGSFGESDPLVPTEDGVAEPRNRRVEVTVR